MSTADVPAVLLSWVDLRTDPYTPLAGGEPDRTAPGPTLTLLFDGPDAEADEWRRKLAARDGPIVPLVRPHPRYDLTRLVVERCVSINTAAAGGNASLLAIGG